MKIRTTITVDKKTKDKVMEHCNRKGIKFSSLVQILLEREMRKVTA